MSLEKLLNAKKTTVGAKQTLKAIQKKEAKMIFVAQNAEGRIVDPIKQACIENNIPMENVESMVVLGKTCGIGVGCAVAALLEE